MKKKGVVIGGFCFTDMKTAEQAKRESEGVRYIRENTDMENPEIVLQLYRKLMVENLFETPVGVGFLKELRDYLTEVPGMQGVDLEPIPAEILMKERELQDIKREKTADRSKMEKKLEHIRKNLQTSLAFNLFLVLVVIGMLVITLTSDQPNIINYENKILDKYSQWQQELDEREKVIREKERELKIAP